MSIPVNHCMIMKAATSEEGFQMLLAIDISNKKNGGYFTIFPGGCTDSCEHGTPTEEQMKSLNERMYEATKDIQIGKSGDSGMVDLIK